MPTPYGCGSEWEDTGCGSGKLDRVLFFIYLYFDSVIAKIKLYVYNYLIFEDILVL